MAEIVLHVGRHKTGTTTLQNFLALNEDRLLKREGILYPQAGRDARHHCHHPLFREFIETGQCIDASLVADVLDEGERRGALRILLSSEMLSRKCVTGDQLQEIRQSFRNNRFSIIVYLRRQDALLQSMYAERVKRGLLAAPDTIHDIDVCLDFHKFIRKYSAVFGENAITIRIYEHASHGIFMDFLEALGASFDSEYVLPERRRNERLPWLYVELLRRANTTALGRKIAVHPLIRQTAIKMRQLFPNAMDRPEPITAAEREILIQTYKESNTRLAQEFLNRSSLFETGNKPEK